MCTLNYCLHDSASNSKHAQKPHKILTPAVKCHGFFQLVETNIHWCRHTHSTLQVHKHTHIWKCPEFWQTPSVFLASLPGYQAPLPAPCVPRPSCHSSSMLTGKHTVLAHLSHRHPIPTGPPEHLHGPSCHCMPQLGPRAAWDLADQAWDFLVDNTHTSELGKIDTQLPLCPFRGGTRYTDCVCGPAAATTAKPLTHFTHSDPSQYLVLGHMPFPLQWVEF